MDHDVDLEGKLEFDGVELKVTKSSMAYKDTLVDKFVAAIEDRFGDEPVIKATRIANVKLWPTSFDAGKHWCWLMLNYLPLETRALIQYKDVILPVWEIPQWNLQNW